MGEIYTILSTCLGTPPAPDQRFTFDYYDKDGAYQDLKTTPLELFANLAPDFEPQDYVVIQNYPHRELGKLFTIDRWQNVKGGRQPLAVNTHIEDLEEAVIRMIKADIPV